MACPTIVLVHSETAQCRSRTLPGADRFKRGKVTALSLWKSVKIFLPQTRLQAALWASNWVKHLKCKDKGKETNLTLIQLGMEVLGEGGLIKGTKKHGVKSFITCTM